MRKFAVALAATLGLGGILVASLWWPVNRAAIHAQSGPPHAAPTPSGQAPFSPVPVAEDSPPAASNVTNVSVKPGETLLEICVASFGRCRPELLQEIRRLNPEVNNLDHIEAGQTIQLPLSVANLGQPDELSISGSSHE